MNKAITATGAAALLALTANAGPALALPRGPADRLPMRLPSVAAAHAADAGGTTWLLGVRGGARAAAVARRAGARQVADGSWVIARARARSLADRLRAAGLLSYAEPDVHLRLASAPDGHPELWARAAVVPATFPLPAAGAARIGVIDQLIDPSHPDVGPQTTYLNAAGRTLEGPHGTMVASAAAAAAGNGGVMGVLPGAPLVSYALPTDITCSAAARGVQAMVDARVAVINMSFGSPRYCATLHRVVEQAVGPGIVVVAAAGNEFQAGNPVIFPAALPHVLSVAAVDPQLRSSFFSDANAAIDISAPGEQVPVAVPPAFDGDGSVDGMTVADGTSFAAPIVAGAAAWVIDARPALTGGQIADVLRFSARDLDRRGWDPDTGWGLVDVAAALTARAPRADPGEPNDDIPMVNGVFFRAADRPLFTGRRTARVSATVDRAEDPDDVYRVRVPARSRLVATVRPAFGDPDLYAFAGTARSLSDRRRLIVSSTRTRGRDRITLINGARRTRPAYLAVDAGSLNAGYRLTVTRG